MRFFIASLMVCLLVSQGHNPAARAAPPEPPELLFSPTATLTGLPGCAAVHSGDSSSDVVDLTISNDCGDTLSISTTEGMCSYVCENTWACSPSGESCENGTHPLSVGESGLEVCDGCEVTLSVGDTLDGSHVIDLQWSLGDESEAGEASLTLDIEVVEVEGWSGCDGGEPFQPTSQLWDEEDEAASDDSSGSEGCQHGGAFGGSPMTALALLLLWAAGGLLPPRRIVQYSGRQITHEPSPPE